MSNKTSLAPVHFRCHNCLRLLTPPYPPHSAPNCPSCGVKMQAEWSGVVMHVQCPKCHTTSDAYKTDRCPKCDGPWQGFTSESSPAQDPDAAFKSGAIRKHAGPTANNLGPGIG